MSGLEWINAVAAVSGSIFALGAWLEARKRPDWTLQPTRDECRWLLTRTGRRKARVLEVTNIEGAQPVFLDSRAAADSRDFPHGHARGLRIEPSHPDTQLSIRYSTWPLWNRDRWWHAPLY